MKVGGVLKDPRPPRSTSEEEGVVRRPDPPEQHRTEGLVRKTVPARGRLGGGAGVT